MHHPTSSPPSPTLTLFSCSIATGGIVLVLVQVYLGVQAETKRVREETARDKAEGSVHAQTSGQSGYGGSLPIEINE